MRLDRLPFLLCQIVAAHRKLPKRSLNHVALPTETPAGRLWVFALTWDLEQSSSPRFPDLCPANWTRLARVLRVTEVLPGGIWARTCRLLRDSGHDLRFAASALPYFMMSSLISPRKFGRQPLQFTGELQGGSAGFGSAQYALCRQKYPILKLCRPNLENKGI